MSTGWRDGKQFHHLRHFISTLRTSPKALLRLFQQHWSNRFAEAKGGTYQESCPLGVLELSTSLNLTSI